MHIKNLGKGNDLPASKRKSKSVLTAIINIIKYPKYNNHDKEDRSKRKKQ